MTVSWCTAIKEHAKLNGGTFKIPKRDTDDYKKIKELQAKMEAGIETPVKTPYVKKKKVAGKEEEVVEEVKVELAPVKAKKVVKVEKAIAPKEVVVGTDDVKAPVKVKKPRVAKVEPVVTPEPVVSAPVAPVKSPRIKKEKVVTEVATKVATKVATEVAQEVAPVKAPRKSNKVQKEEKIAIRSIQSEESARVAAKKALDDTRLLIRNEPVIMRFD